MIVKTYQVLLTQVLVEKVGMELFKADGCGFRLKTSGETIKILRVFVDILVVGEESEVCDALCAFLLQELQTTKGKVS